MTYTFSGHRGLQIAFEIFHGLNQKGGIEFL